MILKEVFEVPFCVGSIHGGLVTGEDVGYCLELKKRNIPIFIVPNYSVEHLSAGSSTNLLVPMLIQQSVPLTTRIESKQLSEPERVLQIPWKVIHAHEHNLEQNDSFLAVIMDDFHLPL